MKNLIKKRIAFFSILAFSIFLLNSCQTENLAVENHEHSKITTKTLIGKEAETIAGRLKQLLPTKTINPKSNLQNQELASSYGTIDYSKIAVVEENGTTTYAFNIIDTNIDDNMFSNLILQEENNYSTVKVAEYVMTQDFAINYYSGQEPITNFEGILNQKTISNNNPCPPDDSSTPIGGIGGVSVGGGSVGVGNNGSSNSGGSYYGGSTLGGGGGMNVTCNNCGRSYGSIDGWQGSICAKYDVTIVIRFSEPPTIAEPNPCDDNGALPLIIFNDNDLILQDFFRNKLNQEQRLFLSSSDPSVNDELNNYLIQNAGTGTIDPDAIIAAKEILNFQMEKDWKTEIKKAIANGITSSAELTHKMYTKLSIIATNHPSSINYINTVIDGVRSAVETVIDTKPQTCNWTDLFNMWLFELGSNPMKFNGPSVTVTSLQGQQGVSEARSIALNQIANGNLNPIQPHGWRYGQEAFYNGMTNGNIATSFLGSYTTNVTIKVLPNGQHMLTFSVTNPSTWDSATRLRIDNDHNDVHDGIFPNHARNEPNTLHIGGNFNQEWTWSETY